MSKMDQRTTVELTAKISGEGLPHAILAEVERLQSQNFNHTRCGSVHLNEPIAEFKSEFPTIELNAALHNKISNDCDNYLPESNQTRVAANFVEEIIPTRHDCAIQENSIGTEFASMLNQLQRQQDLILNKNSELKGEVMQQEQKILDLQKNNLELDGQVMQQRKIIVELRNQLNVLTEVYRLSFASVGETRKAQKMTEIGQKTAAELSYRPQIEIAQVDPTMTKEESIITNCSQTDQLQSIECVQSPTEYEAKTHGNLVGQAGYSAPLSHDNHFNESHGSVIMKQVRSVPSGKGHGKQIKFNLESIEESPTNARKSHQKLQSLTCKECKKQFNTKFELNRHSRIHTGERPWVCKDCGVAFKQFGHLKTHQRIHTGERPYVCAVCGAAFKQSNHLSTHQKLHLKVRPFTCEICTKTFKQKAVLWKHMNIHNRRQFRK